MKPTRDIDKKEGEKCYVWETRPVDASHLHSGGLVSFVTHEGNKINVCKSCYNELSEMNAFLNRRSIEPKVSVMVIEKTEFVDTVKSIEQKRKEQSKFMRRGKNENKNAA